MFALLPEFRAHAHTHTYTHYLSPLLLLLHLLLLLRPLLQQGWGDVRNPPAIEALLDDCGYVMWGCESV